MTGNWEAIPLVCPACRGPLRATGPGVACAACATDYRAKGGVLHLVAGHQGAPAYDPHFFRTLEEVEGRHFWFVARRELVLDSLRRTIPDLDRRGLFDVGCGTGSLAAFLLRHGVAIRGACDAHTESLAIARRSLSRPVVLVDEGRLPPLGGGHDLLTLFDVLEHVDDDVELLRSLRAALRPGGFLALTVPAHPILFDEMDRLAHHRRRYRRRELRAKLETAGFEVRLLTHFMAPLVPLLYLARKAGGRWRALRKDAPAADVELRVVPVLNGLLLLLLAVERRLVRVWSLPFGSSLIAVAVRPEEGDATLTRRGAHL
jgi:2-polyprenyl-3-methyl-5-hydroxy-6-metoxy-1,4-benzoquinol methylase